jgi:predicted RNA-binding Zn-ribbon protein involved in translation (DUF1610 family)
MNNPKIVLWDIETAMTLVGAHTSASGLYGKNLSTKYVLRDWYLLCVCLKELGSGEVTTFTAHDTGLPEDDYNVVKATRDYLEDVDILIAHNGDKFDLKAFNARLMFHKLPPLPKIITVDTLKEARKVARITSNRLDYIAFHFGITERKIKHERDLWRALLFDTGDAEAMREMAKYCAQDVIVLENVYKNLIPYMKSHPNVADVNTMNCPKCNSDDIIKSKTRRTASGIVKTQYQCKCCGSYFTPRASEKEKPLSKM